MKRAAASFAWRWSWPAAAHEAPKTAPAPRRRWPPASAAGRSRGAGRRDEGRGHARHARRRRDRRAVPASLGRHHALLRGGRAEAAVPRRQDRGQAARRRRRAIRSRRSWPRRRSATTTPSAASSRIARELHFAKPHGGAEAEFTYPIEFRARRPRADVGRGARVAVAASAIARTCAQCKDNGVGRMPPSLSMTVYVAPGGKIASAGLAADAPLDDAFASCLVRQDQGVAARRSARQDRQGHRRSRRVAIAIDFELTDEQQLVRDTARDFADARACAEGGGARSLGRVSRRGIARARQARPARRQHPRGARRRAGGRGRLLAGDDGDRARRCVGRGGDGRHQHGRRGDRQVRHRRAAEARACRS